MRLSRVWLAVAAVYGGSAVGLGAYAHHGLNAGEFAIEAFKTGVTYQMWHALALFGVGLLGEREAFAGSKLIAAAGALFTLGVVLFSGTLYAFGLSAEVPVQGAAPAGGFALMAGWACLLFAVLMRWKSG